MVALLFFLLRLLVAPLRPISRLEAENAALRRQLIVVHEQRSPVLPPIVSVVSIDRGGDDDRPTRDAGAMASRGLSPLLALEIPQHGRPAANRCRAADADPTHQHGEYALGCAADSGRTAQARLCGRAVDRCLFDESRDPTLLAMSPSLHLHFWEMQSSSRSHSAHRASCRSVSS